MSLPEKWSSEAAKGRAHNRTQKRRSDREVIAMARTCLVQIGDQLGDVPTDMPDSERVRAVYQDAFNAMRAGDWQTCREKLFQLGVLSLGWAARIGLAEERDPTPPRPQPTAAAAPRELGFLTRDCNSCGVSFDQPRRQGRPRAYCGTCRPLAEAA